MLAYHKQHAVLVKDAATQRTWAKIVTKDPDSLRMIFRVEPQAFTIDEVTPIGGTWKLDRTRSHEDRIRLSVTNMDEVNGELLKEFMKEALYSFRALVARKV
jgi:hypothetical protein